MKLYHLSLFCLLVVVQCAPQKPHIVFVLVDDWGFAEAGFRNPPVKTPNFDMLAKTGVILDRHYVFKYCSPSRASFLSGRWPHHVHQWNPPPYLVAGLNINITTLPAKLKQAGYATHMVGKWHQGFYDPAHLPVNRGFDTSTGFLSGGEDHFMEETVCGVDYWKNKEPDSRNGTYDAYNYRDDLTDILQKHDPTVPFFLYLPLHNVHSPFEAPQEWLDLYPANSTCDMRITLQAMASVADNVTGHVVKLLEKKDMWKDTIFVVSSDNGGAPCAGSNYPLKGCKGTFFEGGVRVIAFANGGFLPEAVKGTTSKAFIHIADWYTTFCKLAGVVPSDSGPGKFPVDGLDVWPILTGESSTTVHEEIVLGYDFENSGAIIAGEYKLIVNQSSHKCDDLMWTPLDYPCKDGPTGEPCKPYCLYNIVTDPEERNELSTKEPTILKQMVERYNKYANEPRDMQDQGYHKSSDLPVEFLQACQYMAEHGQYWRPWKNVTSSRRIAYRYL